MTLLDTTDARNPTPYARELAEQHRARRARFWPAAAKVLVAPLVVVSEPTLEPIPANIYLRAHQVIDRVLTPRLLQMQRAVEVARAADRKKGIIRAKIILRAVSDYYGISVHEMTSARRHKEVVLPRQISMYLAKTLTSRSLPEIGRVVGGRDHTTILHGVSKITALVLTDPKIAADISAIKVIIAGEGGK